MTCNNCRQGWDCPLRSGLGDDICAREAVKLAAWLGALAITAGLGVVLAIAAVV